MLLEVFESEQASLFEMQSQGERRGRPPKLVMPGNEDVDCARQTIAGDSLELRPEQYVRWVATWRGFAVEEFAMPAFRDQALTI